jgi:hypothetical protein
MSFENIYTPPKVVGDPIINKTNAGPFDLSGSRTGSSNPGWKRAVRAGVAATGIFSANHYDFRYTPVSPSHVEWTPTILPNKGLVFADDVRGDAGIAGYVDFGYPLLGDPTTADNRAKADLYGHIKQAQTQMSGQVFLGELREALHMLRSPMQGLRNGMRDYLDRLSKRARGRQTKSSKKRILADTWLEYSFGWMPFIHDMKDANDAIQRVMGRTQRTRCTGLGVDQSYAYHQDLRSQPGVRIWYRTTTRLHREISVKYVVGLADVTLGASDLRLSLDAFGLGISEFVPTAWELLPYSFVVDYFTNAGAVISSVFTDTSAVRWLSKTVRSTTTHKGVVIYDQQYTAQNIGGNTLVLKLSGGSQGEFEMLHKSVTRSMPGLSPPSFTVSCSLFDSLKWVNLVALGAAHKRLVPYY